VADTATVVPYLAVADARRALDWYTEAFGARRLADPIVMPDGRIGHAELEVGASVLMLSDESPDIGVAAPAPGQGSSVTIHLAVPDVDVTLARVLAAGARLERPAADHDYGRNAVIRDPFGHRWMISGMPMVSSPRHGDLGYVSLWVPNVQRAARFFSIVLGWRYGPGSVAQGRQVEGPRLHHGLWGDQHRSNLFLCFAVEDIASAVERVRVAGGTAAEPQEEPYGLISECVDDQSSPFALFEPPAGTRPAGEGGPAPVASGEVAYITMEVVDSSRARAFYASVLGWSYLPGHVEDGWQVEDVEPMVGMSGGHAVATSLPMYRVQDIDDAVARVRAGGGTATDPQPRPHGISSECVDDQGTRFYLGQLP
jgi:uncharacterized glyoxalase superfamily protein PhnB